jgi:hypothetical protein
MKLHELTRHLAKGNQVYWTNDGYKVHWSGDIIRITYISNGFGAALDISELDQCYVKEATQ